jgi:hypothetical protein
MPQTLRLFLILMLLSSRTGFSQGIYTEFGQNRVQFRSFQWKVYTEGSADFLYYDDFSQVARFAAVQVAEFLPKLEKLYGYKASNRAQFMLFSSLSDYRQNNIGYVNPQWHSGGITFIPAEALPIYFSGDYASFKKQIHKGLCDYLLKEMVYGGTLQDRFERLRSPQLPYWFLEGLAALSAEGWDAVSESELRDGMGSGEFDNFNTLNQDQLRLAGKSMWKYIVETYGVESISGMLFIARYTHSAEAGISYYSKSNLAEFIRQWKTHYISEFASQNPLQLPKGKANIPRKLSLIPNTGLDINADGDCLSVITNDHGKFSLWLYYIESGKTKKVYQGGQKVLNQITDFSFPKARWKNNKLYLLTFEQGNYKLLTYNLDGKKTGTFYFHGFHAINDFDILSNSDSMVFTATNNHHSDIYKTKLTGGKVKQVTNDTFFEHQLNWLKDGRLIYAMRNADEIDDFYMIKQGKKQQITRFEEKTNLLSPILINDSMLGFLADFNGMRNAWVVNINNPSIRFGLTNYQRSIIGQTVSENRQIFAEMVKLNGRYTIYTGNVNEDPVEEQITVSPLPYLNLWKENALFKQVLPLRAQPKNQVQDTALQIPENHDNQYRYQTGFSRIDYHSEALPKKENASALVSTGNFNPVLPDFIITQIDNKNIGTYLYDSQIPMDVLKNPWLMPYVKFSLSDLQRNWNIEAGVRSNLGLNFTDFHVKAGYYAKRVDHEWTYFRRNRKFDVDPNLYQQNITQLFGYKIQRPVDERLRMTLGLGWRRETILTKITENNALEIPDRNKNYLEQKLELLFDNSVSSGLNNVTGTRAKWSIVNMVNIGEKQSLQWLEMDMRKYFPVGRFLMVAQRISGAYNLGKTKVGYYMGGVENWTAKDQIPSKLIMLPQQDLALQQWVCNLRGYYRGARMGHSFMLSNTELRLPLMKMIYRKPLSAEFFKHFTITGFADLGCAFTGQTPADPTNPYNTVYLNTPNYNMSITSQRNPWLLGLGYGVRSRVLGYFVKYDRAWGFQENQWQSPINYFSLGLDF